MTQTNQNTELAPARGDAAASVWDKVRALRHARGETGEQFGQMIGLAKSKVSELEAGKYAPSVAVAVAIEQLAASSGHEKIDAALLCEGVRTARHGLVASAVHAIGVAQA